MLATRQLNFADIAPQLDGVAGIQKEQYAASISYGKDSLAMLHVITEVLKKPLDRIVTAEVWATDTIPADLPPMQEFKVKADEIILKRYGIKVEHFCAMRDGQKETFERVFYREHTQSRNGWNGRIYGWPSFGFQWCQGMLKATALSLARKGTNGCVQYVGIAADEPERIKRHTIKPNVLLPLDEAGWTEAMCRDWCEMNGLLSPIYKNAARGGCWFCIYQGLGELRKIWREYPEYWGMLKKWDEDSYFHQMKQRPLLDYEKRFVYEEEHGMPTRWKWELIK